MEKSEFIKRYESLGGKYEEIQPNAAIRVNTLLITPEELVVRMGKKGVELRKIPYLEHGYEVLESPFSVGSTIEYLLGYYYIQSAPAQLPASILAPRSTDKVLDACASPGGKTTHLAQIMKNKGVIISIEKKKERLGRLINNLDRMQVANCEVMNIDARNAARAQVEFDRALLDVPCSGNYVQEKDWFSKRDIDGIKRMAKLQKEILKAALHVVKKGGEIVYSTCSLEPEENEMVIDWAIKNFPLTLEETGLPGKGITDVFGKKLDAQLEKTRRFWPHKMNTEGFFIARLRKC